MEMELSTNSTLDRDNVYANVMYDQIWAFALALHNSLELLEEALENLQLQQQTQEFASILQIALSNISFEGASGFVNFDSDMQERGVVKISQAINSTAELVGVYTQDTRTLKLLREVAPLPDDRFETRALLLPLWLSTLFNIFFLICIVVTTSALIFLLV